MLSCARFLEHPPLQVNNDNDLDVAATTTSSYGAVYILFLGAARALLSFQKLVPSPAAGLVSRTPFARFLCWHHSAS